MSIITSAERGVCSSPADRQLASATTDEDGLCKYFYNENGFLSQIDVYEKDKTAPVSKYVYIWDNDKLIARQIISYDPQDNGLIMTSRIIYDADDEPQGFILQQEQNGISGMSATFLYRKNLQGDITGVIDSLSGKILVEYIYDAYGNPQVITDGSIESAIISIVITAYNPLLYRGYIYTNLGGEFAYYLGSRFYNPELGRFLNADKHTDTDTGVLGTNMFAYCNNNPVMYVDPTGEFIRILNFLKTAITFIKKVVSSLVSGNVSIDTLDNNAIWPVKNCDIVNSPWGFRDFGKNRHHQGVDIPVTIGTPVFAIADGTVVTINKSRSDSQGIYIVLKHEMDGVTYYTRYMHLDQIQQGLVRGQQVSIGDQIGLSGNTAESGNTVGAHLHFQIQLENTDSRSKTINPCIMYHKFDTRSSMNNPNPFFIKKDDKYVFNDSFSIEKSFEYFDTSNENNWSVSTDYKYLK